MPLDEDDLANRGRFHPGLVRQIDQIDFRDLIYGMGESVAHAQAALDYEVAETMTRFAETEVDVVSRVTRTVRPDGTFVDEPQQTEKRSLLELGLTPTRYQFSEATIDVEFDLSFAIDETETGKERREARFRVDTSEAHHRRRYHGEANTTARISARLVPVPTPAALTPATVESVSGQTTGNGADDGADTGLVDDGADETSEASKADETGGA